MLIDEGLELLPEQDALELLAGGEVGRVGVTIGALPAIFPVNYRLIDGTIVFRTAPGSKLAPSSRSRSTSSTLRRAPGGASSSSATPRSSTTST